MGDDGVDRQFARSGDDGHTSGQRNPRRGRGGSSAVAHFREVSESNFRIFESIPEPCLGFDIVRLTVQDLLSIFLGEQLFYKSGQEHPLL